MTRRLIDVAAVVPKGWLVRGSSGGLDGVVAAVDRIADELYGVDPDTFVQARTAASARARAAGDRTLAKELAALRKPTRSAWLLNLLARSHPVLLGVLPDLAERLAAATSAVDVSAMRAAGIERTARVAELTRLAVEEGRRAGYDGGDTVRNEVSNTLHAALADPDVLSTVLAGRLDKAQVYAGFGLPMTPYVPSTVAAPAVGPSLEPDEGPLNAPAPDVFSAAARPGGGASLDRRAASAREELQRRTVRYEEALAGRRQAESADESARAVLDRASQEVADLRAELKAAEAAELAARDAATDASDLLHDARTAEQQATAALDRARRTLEATT